jgi:Mannosyltransferase putative
MSSTAPDGRDDALPTPANLPDIAGDGFSGRGIVICAGGVRMFTNAWVLLWVLRRVHGCRLPIEIWHLGPQEMSRSMAQMLEGLGANVIDAFTVLSRYPAEIYDGWQLKAYAVVRSEFREVLLLDADNLPTADPAFLFDRPEFTETGAVFWPDFVDLAATNPIWKALDLPAEQRVSFESGQAVIDKGRHGDALKMLLYLNENAERFYQMIYGDKDTFLVAWLATDSDFTLVRHRPFAERYTTYQRGFDGNVLFQHRTGRKWSYADERCEEDGFVHKTDCLKALAELRRIWNGRIYEPPSRSLAARRLESELAGTFILSTPGEEDRELELLAGAQIGKGRDAFYQTWHISEPTPGDFVLSISDHLKVRHEFRRQDKSIWSKPAVESEPGNRICLIPAGPLAGSVADGISDCGLVRDILRGALAGQPWSADLVDQLRVTFGTLCQVEPALADDLEKFALVAFPEGVEQTTLLDLVSTLKDTGHRKRAEGEVRSSPEMLGDRNYYVRP